MLKEDAIKRLKEIPTPPSHFSYQEKILSDFESSYILASKARKIGYDPSDMVESKIAYDLADRVAKMHEINISERLRLLLSQNTKEIAALKIAEEIALGQYGSGDLRTRLDNAVRVSLAVVTEGVTVAPLQGISDVQIKQNADGSSYLSVFFAGPIRSAGGTEAALTMLIADHARKAAGLSTYIANSFDDESGRFVEELRIYEREVGNFQFKVLDEDVIKCITSLPVELDGVDTDPVELVGHRGMKRIATDRVRGGALRVMNDGLIGRSRKLLKLVEILELDGWEWLKELKGAIQTGDDDAAHHRMSEVITGRPVLSMSKMIGGFRLRYGRCFNTGFATVGVHSVIPTLLNNAVVVGTQIKMDMPGKASTLALVDTIESPIVRLFDGTVKQIYTIDEAKGLQNKIEKILYLGDILISYGDFLENNAQLPPASYVEEIWSLQLKDKLDEIKEKKIIHDIDFDRLVKLSVDPLTVPTVIEAFKISIYFDIPLYPKYNFYWEAITIDELLHLKKSLSKMLNSIKDLSQVIDNSNVFTINYENKIKDILEKLGVFHRVIEQDQTLQFLDNAQAFSLIKLLTSNPESFYDERNCSSMNNTVEYINCISNVKIKSKFASSIAIRVGRPEKAAERKMKPPVHSLFPVRNKGGSTRDILKAAQGNSFFIELANRFCTKCDIPSLSVKCRMCNTETPLKAQCKSCKVTLENANIKSKCNRCGKDCKTSSIVSFPLKNFLNASERQLHIKTREPFKGVKEVMNRNNVVEVLDKGILRQNHNLYTFKDGTIRYDATNEPITHFKPKWVGTSIDKLKELGYISDLNGSDIDKGDQIVELFLQDIIIPIDSAKHLLKVAQFIDDELVKLYGLEPFYNSHSIDDLVGHLVVGLAPHTSVGIVGRIIGFTNSQVCLASPIWHSAKRRDCDGDADSIMLLMDAFLNFSYDFLPDKIGGLMDAPLLIQPTVLPHEVQRQAHNVDIAKFYPLDFYELTWNQAKASEAVGKIEIVKDRIGKEKQFFDYLYTHTTDILTSDIQHSAYSTLNTMQEKLNMQISIARLINAVDPNEVISAVLNTHIIPDIMGNMRSYSSQSFRCTKCGEKYRRIPLINKCECGHELILTVSRGSVEKYVGIAASMCEQFKVNEYLNSRIESLINELKLIFKEVKKEQSTLLEFMDE